MDICDVPGLLPVEMALAYMQSYLKPVNETERVDLMSAKNRVLSAPLVSSVNVPPADNSAMDGYALKSSDLKQGTPLKMVGTSLAGQPYTGTLSSGQCVRIMTGAVIPEGADCVVMQEKTQPNGQDVFFDYTPKAGENVRQKGEDILRNSEVIPAGTVLTAAHLSLIASIGIDTCHVTRKIKVALLATGDELTPPGQTLNPGGIYESNRYALRALLENAGAEVLDLGIIEDTPEAIKKALEIANESCDLVLTSGGVSVGDADFVKQVLEEIGEINFWKVAIKPGKPFAFGKLSKAWFCGLPGNPVSSYVTFEHLVLPLIEQLSGKLSTPRPYFYATCSEVLKKRPGRADYQRGIFYRDENGTLLVKANGKQGSGIMSSIANANCYIILEKDSEDVPTGSQVKIQPF